MSDTNTFFPVGKDIKINGETFNIQPFVVKNRIKVVRIMTDVVLEISKSGSKFQAEDVVQYVPKLIEIFGDRLIEVYEIVLKKDRDWVENNIKIVDEIEILNAIVEVNDIPLLWGQISKLVPRLPKTS